MMMNLVRVGVIAGALAVSSLVAPAAQAYGPTEPPGPVRNVQTVDGWGAASISWWDPDTGGGWETAYHLRVLDPTGTVVATHTNSGFNTRHTFGQLENGTTYTIEITAENDIGTGPPMSGQVTPYVPDTFTELYIYGECPGWTVVNPNRFPVTFTWETSKASGINVIREGDGRKIVPDGDPNKFSVYVDGELHDKDDEGACPRTSKK
ncbi:MAG: fibronectin type III domain-containing protein [Micromonosporaceae bacterium]